MSAAKETYELASDASISLQTANNYLKALHVRHGENLENIKMQKSICTDASDFEEAITMAIDLLADLCGMADKVCDDIDAEGGPAAVDRDAAICDAAEARRDF